MQKSTFRVTSIIAAVMLLGVAVITPFSSVSAASNSLGVNPRRDYTIKSGDKVTDTLFVSNLSKTDALSVSIQLVDFGAQNETGSPQLLLNQKEPTRWSLKSYLTIPSTVTIAAGKSAEVPFTIAIPSKVGAGSYYGAIKYSADGDHSSSNVSLVSSSATLMFVRVPGEANDAIRLKQFGAFTPDTSGNDGTFGSLYIGSAPKYLSYRLVNNGNVAELPTGSVLVKNIFGKQTKLFQDANPNKNVVLIDQTRRIDLCINESKITKTDATTGRSVDETVCNDSKLAPGRYTAKLAIVYGDNGSSSHDLGAVVSFWYLPVWFIVLVLIVLAVAVLVVAMLVRKISRRGDRR